MSGFRDYPQQGFQIQPPSNYWEGNNFMMPGINAGGPTMSSDMMERFPGLAGILRVASPPPMAGGPFVGGMPMRQRPQVPGRQQGRSPLELLMQRKG